MTSVRHWTASDGAQLCFRYDDCTDPWAAAPLAVLLHPGMGSSRRLYGWVPTLSRDYRVVRPDLRGHGQSEPGDPETLSHERLARDLVELLDHLGAASAHVMGSSAGGMIAAQAALRWPGRFRSLALYSATAGIPPGRPRKGDWYGKLQRLGIRGFLRDTVQDRIGAASPAKIEWYLDSAEGLTPEFLARFVPLMASEDFTDRLDALTLPVLVVIPDPDPMVERCEYERLCAHLQHHSLVAIPAAGHGMSAEIPDVCAGIYRGFLDRQERP